MSVCQRTSGPLPEFPDVPMFGDVTEALDRAPDLAIVATPTASHVAVAIEAARRGIHLLVEKPVSHTLDGVELLRRLVSERQTVAMVGYNLRFHPGLRRLRQLLRDGAIGRPLFVQASAGQYLPDWRPGRDYRTVYSSRAELGGGVLLDLSHELDYLQWLFGPATQVSAMVDRIGRLDIDVEDTAVILARFESGVVGQVQLDYLRRPPRRYCEVIGEAGTAELDLLGQHLAVVDHRGQRRVCWTGGPDSDVNETYLAELGECLGAVVESRAPAISLDDGIRALQFALAARRSAETGRVQVP